MVKISILYKGELRCEATHDASNAKFITDAPVDNEEKGERFSPTDLVATAVGTCAITTMGIVAQRHNIKLDGTKVFVEKYMNTDKPRRIAKIIVQLEMCEGIPEEFREKLENAAHKCPVEKSLHPDVVIDMSFIYPKKIKN